MNKSRVDEDVDDSQNREDKLNKRRRLISLVSLSLRRNSLLHPTLLLSFLLCALLAFIWIRSYQDHTVTSAVKFDRERDRDYLSSQLDHFPPLEELLDKNRLWPPDLDTPICSPKIFVYELPPNLRLTSAQTAQCRWSAYNSELLLSKLLHHLPSSPSFQTLTTNPADADFFFIPLFPSCFLFNCWVKAGWKKHLRCDVERGHILPIMEFVRSHDSWQRKGGSDHLIIHPMDFGDGYYTEEARMAMNESIYLVTVGDLRPKPYSQHYRRFRDIVIPSSTHLINSYYLNPRDYVNEHGHPFVHPPPLQDSLEPIKPQIWIPTILTSPTTASKVTNWGKNLFGRRRTQMAAQNTEREITERTTTAIFRGGRGRPDEGEEYALGIRSLFFPSNSSLPNLPQHSGFSSLPGYDIAEWSENPEYATALARSKFGLAPPGYTLDTTRLYEYLAFGVVPVFIGTGQHAGQVMPFQDDFSYDEFSIFIPRERAHEVPRILAGVGEEKYKRLRKRVWEVGRRLVLEEGRGEVWKWIARDLCRRGGIETAAGDVIRYT